MPEHQTIPAFDTPQQLRAAVQMELEMSGLSDVQRQAVMKSVDAYILETIVASASEMLTSQRNDLRWTLWDIEHRVLPDAPIGGEEMLSRVTATAATRANVLDGYNKLRQRLQDAPRPAAAPPPTPQAPPQVIQVFQPPMMLSPRPGLTPGTRRLLILLGIIITFVIVIWFLNVSGIAKMMQQGTPTMSAPVQQGTPTPQKPRR